uniref:Uncharacterized protein n=1 Tax=Salix viminalis TaxID=40686 RepID=A0A6N2KED0_SALVM
MTLHYPLSLQSSGLSAYLTDGTQPQGGPENNPPEDSVICHLFRSIIRRHVTWEMKTLMRKSEAAPLILRFHRWSHPQKPLVLNPIHTEASELLWMI